MLIMTKVAIQCITIKFYLLYNKYMTKNKKIIILLVSAVAILLIAFGAYRYFTVRSYNQSMQEIRQQIEEAGFNNISGTVKSVEGNNLKILAKVPENYSLLPVGETKYIEKEFLLKILPDSQMYSSEMRVDGEFLTKLNSLGGVKPNEIISAIVKENILKNNELNVVELIIVE